MLFLCKKLRYTKCYANFDSNLSLCLQTRIFARVIRAKRQANDKNQQKSYSYHLNQTGDMGPNTCLTRKPHTQFDMHVR